MDALANVFSHFEKRVLDRYNRVIDRDGWVKIGEDIKNKKAKFIGYKESEQAELWYCDKMVVLFSRGYPRTVLPIEDYKKAIERLSDSEGWRPEGDSGYVSAASMLKMFYDLKVSHSEWEDIKRESEKETLVLKHTVDNKKLKRIIYKSRELFLMVDSVNVRVVRPSRGLIASVRYRKKEYPVEILARAIRNHSPV